MYKILELYVLLSKLCKQNTPANTALTSQN